MLIRIRRSKDLLWQFQWFECCSLFTSNSCVYCTTRYNECGRIGTKWLVFFFYLYWRNVVLWLKRTSTKKLANRISYQIWYKGCLKGKFGRVVQIYEGGSISASGFGPGGSKSAVTPAREKIRSTFFSGSENLQLRKRLEMSFLQLCRGTTWDMQLRSSR